MGVLNGACHCGAVTWAFNKPIDGATACNCTLCRRYGALWAYDFLDEGITVSGETRAYAWGNRWIEFHFCTECGCIGYWRAVATDDAGRRRMAVNIRLATDPAAVAAIPIDHFDGFRTFEDLPRDGRCVVDYWF